MLKGLNPTANLSANGVVGVLPALNGGTGVANGSNSSLTLSGNVPLAFVLPAAGSNITLPASGTLITQANLSSVTGGPLAAANGGTGIANASNTSLTIGGNTPLRLNSGAAGSNVTVPASGTLLTADSGGNLTISGRFITTVAQGNAPIVTASNTVVANLNVSLLQGGNWVAPESNLGTTTAVNTANITNINMTTLSSLANSIKIGSLTRAMNAASGAVAYTGVGFLPSRIIFFSVFNISLWNAFSWGVDDGTTTGCSYWQTATVGGADTTVSIELGNIANDSLQKAKITALGADGFTLTWTLIGAGNAGTATVFYVAFK